MADDDTPKSRSAADKEKSRQQSRPITGKEASKGVSGQPGKAQKAVGQRPAKGGQGAGRGSGSAKGPASKTGTKGPGAKSAGGGKGSGGGRGPKPGARPAPGRPPRRSLTALLTWGAIALVLVVVVVLVVVKITSSSTPTTAQTGFIATSQQIVHDATNIPDSVYNKVGTSSSVAQVSPPTVVKGQKPLVINGLPGIYYYGAEFCPYCAAERWALVASLSRFGKWSNLGDMTSSSTDVFPSTQTFTFQKATFTSPYVALQTSEVESNIANPAGGYTALQKPTAAEQALVTKYDTPKYFPGAQAGSFAFPFISIGNKSLISGASYSPSILQGLSRSEISSNLNDPTNPATQAIVASSNYISASVCNATGGMPSSVCTSKGVTEAAKGLGFSS